MMNLFGTPAKKPASSWPNNFDPLQQHELATRGAPNAPSALGSPSAAAARDGPLLLRVVDELAQAALKARNDLLAELNAAASQQREVHAAAKARLEQELSAMASTASKLSDRLFFTARGAMNVVPQAGPAGLAAAAAPLPPRGSDSSEPPQQQRDEPRAAPAAAAEQRQAARPAPPAAEAADAEVASVNARPGPTLDAMNAELASLREEKSRTRLREREEFESMVAAAAEQRAAGEVQALRAALERATAQKRSLLQELETLSREHSELQHAFNRGPGRGGVEARARARAVPPASGRPAVRAARALTCASAASLRRARRTTRRATAWTACPSSTPGPRPRTRAARRATPTR
jgi:hypothetical protein